MSWGSETRKRCCPCCNPNTDLVLNGEAGAMRRRGGCVDYLESSADGTMQPVTRAIEGVHVPRRGGDALSEGISVCMANAGLMLAASLPL